MAAVVDQDALRLVLQTRLQVDAVGPDVDVALGRQVALAPSLVFVGPDLLQPRDGRGRQPGRPCRARRPAPARSRRSTRLSDRGSGSVYRGSSNAGRRAGRIAGVEADARRIVSDRLRSRTRGWRTATGPMPVMIWRSGRCRDRTSAGSPRRSSDRRSRPEARTLPLRPPGFEERARASHGTWSPDRSKSLGSISSPRRCHSDTAYGSFR